MHIGETGYYATLQHLIATLEASGALVQYEAITKATEEEWATATDEERAAIKALFDDRKLLESILGRYGWVSQHALPYQEHWVNVDLTDLELVRLIGPENIPAMGLTAQDGDLGAPLMAILFRALAWDRLGLLRYLIRRDEGRRQFENVVVNHRNTVAGQGLFSTDPGRDVVLIWGADHLTGIGGLLRQAGFRHTGTQWLNAGHLPPLLSSVRELRVALAAFSERTTRNPP